MGLQTANWPSVEQMDWFRWQIDSSTPGTFDRLVLVFSDDMPELKLKIVRSTFYELERSEMSYHHRLKVSTPVFPRLASSRDGGWFHRETSADPGWIPAASAQDPGIQHSHWPWSALMPGRSLSYAWTAVPRRSWSRAGRRVTRPWRDLRSTIRCSIILAGSNMAYLSRQVNSNVFFFKLNKVLKYTASVVTSSRQHFALCAATL